ncbi:MAG: hypothetical protein IKC69_01850 [Clostridia bacterium]|nr:hypothetical protein [Clostridia bacterium]
MGAAVEKGKGEGRKPAADFFGHRKRRNGASDESGLTLRKGHAFSVGAICFPSKQKASKGIDISGKSY